MNVSLYQAAAALNASNRWQDVIGENLASSSIYGYKKQEISFASIQAGFLPKGANSLQGGPERFELTRAAFSTNFAPGELNSTGEPFDLALEGPGFFEMQLPSGQMGYTRNGSCTMSLTGQLISKAGYPVMGQNGPIQLDPKSTAPVTIERNGEVRQGPDVKGKIKLVNFDKPELLAGVGGAYFMAVDPQIQIQELTNPTLRQGMLEASNASSVHEMASLIMAMRMYEANQKVIQTHDERMTKAINELGNPTAG